MKLREYVVGHDRGPSHGSKTYVIHGTSEDLECLGEEISAAARNPPQEAAAIAIERHRHGRRNYIEFRAVSNSDLEQLQAPRIGAMTLWVSRFCAILALLFLAWHGFRDLWSSTF